jgi:hypothetical protein
MNVNKNVFLNQPVFVEFKFELKKFTLKWIIN